MTAKRATLNHRGQRMTSKHKLVGLSLGAVVAAAVFGACSDDFDSLSALAPAKEFFTATLTGDAERPNPVTTTASGSAEITILNPDLIRVETLVSATDSVTQAHIHAGDAASAGPVMVFLFGPVVNAQGQPSATRQGVTGVLSVRDIQRGVTAFSSPFTFDSLLTRIRAGTAYVNVHTRRNLGGEIRGQIVPQ
jgi:CHRD domain